MNTKITFKDNRQVSSIVYFNTEGKKHNNGDIPAMIFYHDNGKLWKEMYCENGTLHRDENEGPAVIQYEEDGKTLHQEEYFRNGKPHRSNGLPASIGYIKK